MTWKITILEQAVKDLRKLDKPIARRIVDFLNNRLAVLDDPRSTGKALIGPKYGELWRYRVGDYRIIAKIEDEELKILVVHVGPRKDVYK